MLVGNSDSFSDKCVNLLQRTILSACPTPAKLRGPDSIFYAGTTLKMNVRVWARSFAAASSSWMRRDLPVTYAWLSADWFCLQSCCFYLPACSCLFGISKPVRHAQVLSFYVAWSNVDAKESPTNSYSLFSLHTFQKEQAALVIVLTWLRKGAQKERTSHKS